MLSMNIEYIEQIMTLIATSVAAVLGLLQIIKLVHQFSQRDGKSEKQGEDDGRDDEA